MERRTFIRAGAAAGAAALVDARGVAASINAPEPTAERAFHHSICRWPFRALGDLPAIAQAAHALGIRSVELLEPEEWPVVQQYGLTCAMSNAPGDPRRRLTHGFNRIEHHEWLVPAYRELIANAAAAGVPNVICFSGNRAGLDDDEGIENCARGLLEIVGDAERHGVTIAMELLNSRVDHADYQCDRTPWGVALVKRVGSPRFRLLYDIYHMQIMEGDVIRTIRDNHEYIAHYHTAGVPGRHEIDDTQELNYRAVMRAIAETGFDGYVAQEFTPVRDARASLEQAIGICSV